MCEDCRRSNFSIGLANHFIMLQIVGYVGEGMAGACYVARHLHHEAVILILNSAARLERAADRCMCRKSNLGEYEDEP